MTDQLRQALRTIHIPTLRVEDERKLALIRRAAEAWSEFPTDVQVEAAALALWMDGHDVPPPEGPIAVEQFKRYRRQARAALEAAHNTGKDGP